MNNPECAFFTGAFVGQSLAIKWVLMMAGLYYVFKAVDKLAFEPFIEWIKKFMGLKNGKK